MAQIVKGGNCEECSRSEGDIGIAERKEAKDRVVSTLFYLSANFAQTICNRNVMCAID